MRSGPLREKLMLFYQELAISLTSILPLALHVYTHHAHSWLPSKGLVVMPLAEANWQYEAPKSPELPVET